MGAAGTQVTLAEIRERLRAFEFITLFNELGWDHFHNRFEVEVGEATYALSGVAEKHGVQVFRSGPGADGGLPDRATRRAIDREVGRRAHEHLLIFTDGGETTQIWRWELSEPGRPRRPYEYELHPGQSGEMLSQRLQELFISIRPDQSSCLFYRHTGRDSRNVVAGLELNRSNLSVDYLGQSLCGSRDLRRIGDRFMMLQRLTNHRVRSSNALNRFEFLGFATNGDYRTSGEEFIDDPSDLGIPAHFLRQQVD